MFSIGFDLILKSLMFIKSETLNLKTTFGKQRKWREMLFHPWVKHKKYATEVPDVVTYEYYDCFSFQLNTLIHKIIKYNHLTRI